MKRIACILLPLFVLSGCAVTAAPSSDDGSSSDDVTDDSDSTSSKKKTSSSKSDDDRAPSTTTKAPADTTPAQQAPAEPAGPDITYGATVAATDPVPFGGTNAAGTEFCALQNFKDLSITVVATSKGLVKSFTLKATNVEQANPNCPTVTAQPENQHVYTYTNANPTDAPAKLVAAPQNKPQADLVADVAVHADAGGRATINFHRSDVGAPLDWKYTLQFQLTKQ